MQKQKAKQPKLDITPPCLQDVLVRCCLATVSTENIGTKTTIVPWHMFDNTNFEQFVGNQTLG